MRYSLIVSFKYSAILCLCMPTLHSACHPYTWKQFGGRHQIIFGGRNQKYLAGTASVILCSETNNDVVDMNIMMFCVSEIGS